MPRVQCVRAESHVRGGATQFSHIHVTLRVEKYSMMLNVKTQRRVN